MVYVMVGLPASGKTTAAIELMTGLGETGIYLSSDALREELYGDRKDQKHNREVFAEMKKRLDLAIDSRYDVIYDATNLNRTRREDLISHIHSKEEDAVCIFLDTPVVDCLVRNEKREHQVPPATINLMNRTFDRPQKSEGWDRFVTVE